MKKIAIVGSTGSIGVNTLRVLKAHPGKFKVVALAAKKNAEGLLKQALLLRPDMVCLYDDAKAMWLSQRLKPYKIKVVTGDDGLMAVSMHPAAEQVIFAVVGGVGLRPLFAAISSGKNVAVANKEPLVMAGELLMRKVKEKKVNLLPIDSEHSGLWQCLEGRARAGIKNLILTSSGGPFFLKKQPLKYVTVKDALNHPRWRMGPKITIDSATLMNKGLEVIEASHLFETPVDRIQVVIHPQAIIHALVEFVDGSQLAQLGITDMRLPIQYALSYPARLVNSLPRLELTKLEAIEFYRPDRKRFPCLELGYAAQKAGGTMPAVLNAANEIAVEKFLNHRLPLISIPKIISKVMNRHHIKKNASLSQILEADAWAREEAGNLC
ncbi:MAG: 1-deoxy-D-xylulose-5-phosphate reductoisomerase [Candidatus Omnitrophica bacterium CG11_big_fil_rev_8_21_14_0_20_45_26]|uniref:1-deoxy-D-xylulose 5-phosphate reductoisomerase n=1 Tax=Candidatus Abzuiibacterium crystallinum TaxID=1974748 RepID=A0A2H0LT34_9BACT|nr:MAG: 1-deoxy-D-xylulose-5-phosphate reductoisomerase [Candidatus Omnitrophica bacterium CG11_big_fil_rev_8_21_14_0_20_45_26]PIW65455.1 MAG: 1-deoxy-D-xylulose-5-phosphate reductoisomerase [Candidatus Omnitrophica bacterium CG12_big_fil_rev_8_21_14_0_65_45_16]